MKRTSLLALLLLVPACRNPAESNDGQGQRSSAPVAAGPAPLVTGTVLDARTGKPVAGARVVGPGGVEAKSDAHGRFVLHGLTLGAEGELVGTTTAGLTGKNRLRALASGPLEVVLYLR
ncbi:MAG: carboxypeptidase regulatory-like domain-containing protein [Planctomycetes bacterium]|nr:carboxypeptidase regulatory-like domain-containing protein [Planctomycetota bacterium]